MLVASQEYSHDQLMEEDKAQVQFVIEFAKLVSTKAEKPNDILHFYSGVAPRDSEKKSSQWTELWVVHFIHQLCMETELIQNRVTHELLGNGKWLS